MKVGLFVNTQYPEGDDVAARIPELVEQMRTARDMDMLSGGIRRRGEIFK